MTDYTDLIAKLRMVERKDISSHLYPFAPGVVAMAEECIAALEQLVAERDAAVADLHKALRSEVGSPCDLCLYDAEAPDGMHSCSISELLSDPCTVAEWRGAQKGATP